MENALIILFGLTMLYMAATSRLMAHIRILVLQGILPRRFGLKREYYFFVTPPAPTSSRRQPERIPIKNKLAETIANAKETS